MEECGENIDGNEILYNETLDVFHWVFIEKYVVLAWYSIICFFNNKYMHLFCFYLFLLVFQKR